MGRHGHGKGMIRCRIQQRSVIMFIRNHVSSGIPQRDDTLKTRASGNNGTLGGDSEPPATTSQLPPSQWHDRMEEKILADAIIDRITTNAHATVLTCDDSMRKHFSQLG